MIIQIKFKLKRPFPGKFIEKIPILWDYLSQEPPEDTQKSQIFNIIQEKSLLTKNVYFYI